MNGKEQSTFPKKYEGYVNTGVDCTNGAKGTWNEKDWNITIENLQQSKTVCKVKFERYEDSILNGADPVLGENLIPVTIDDNGQVKKANTQEAWYNYEEQEWANAVILTEGTPEPDVGAVIDENNIESYFVWIPRYKYQIWEDENYTDPIESVSSKVHPIEIQFETTNDVASNGSKVNDWLTHPAFTAFGVNGLWVGKFESGYKGAESTEAAEVNPGNEEAATEAANQLQIKPDVYSWRGIQTANAHLVSYNYQRELDSHMMKNTEWGAVAYLTNSIYGRCKGNQCTEVIKNNTTDSKTGYGAVHAPTATNWNTAGISCTEHPDNCNEVGLSTQSEITQPWNTTTGVLASTTGNITGIYDMSGGVYDCVMGVVADENGKPMSGVSTSENSGFSGKNNDGTVTSGIDFPNKKYYDLYFTDESGYALRILGDATSETGPFTKTGRPFTTSSWYDDVYDLVNNRYPWYMRGSNRSYGIETGIFAISATTSGLGDGKGFRVVLAP